MDTVVLVAERGDERFEILDDGGGVGLYVFRYVAGQLTHDYFQLDLPMAQQCAQHQWGLVPTAWRTPEPGELPLWKRRKQE
jgi:hypothetical protein